MRSLNLTAFVIAAEFIYPFYPVMATLHVVYIQFNYCCSTFLCFSEDVCIPPNSIVKCLANGWFINNSILSLIEMVPNSPTEYVVYLC